MSAVYTLDAQIRTDLGKGASRRLRHTLRAPAIIYGGNEAPMSISLEHKHVVKAQENEGFYSHILTLNVDGTPIECIIKDMQRHPFKPIVLHMDFLRVDATHKLHTSVPIHFTNETTNAAVKAGGVVNHLVNEIEISCLPKHLPEFIEVNVAKLAIGDSLHLSDLTLPAGVSSIELAKGEGHDLALVNIQTPRGAAVADEEEAPAAE